MATSTETLLTVKISLKIKIFALLSLVGLAITTVLIWSFLHDTKETFDTAGQQYALTVGALLLDLLLGLLAFWLCLHRTLAPLQAIIRAVRRIAAGDLPQPRLQGLHTLSVDDNATVCTRPHAQRPPAFEVTAEPQRPETTSHHGVASPGVASLDSKVLDTLRALPHGAASLQQVLRTYLKATPSLVAALQDAISRGDASDVYRAAHSLNSSSAAVGAMSLAALCKTLEDMGRANTLTTAHTLLRGLEAEYAAVCTALERELPHEAA